MTSTFIATNGRRKAVWGPRRALTSLVLAGALGFAAAPVAAESNASKGHAVDPRQPAKHVKNYKLDDELQKAADRGPRDKTTRVIVELKPGARVPSDLNKFGRLGARLGIINGQVVDVPNSLLKKLADHSDVFRLHFDRPAQTHNYRTSVTVGANTVRQSLGYTGAGVGVAVIDSGITAWHDDLTRGFSFTSYPYGNQRVTKFVDFVNGATLPYDDNGHGTHVSGTIAGNGLDSLGQKAGIAPGASLVSLKVLDAEGRGSISHMIAALDWVSQNSAAYKIRVVNMSVGAPVHESYWTDPLTLAAKRVVEQGIVVVCAAGNFGHDSSGRPQWGAITAPGNAPWVLTVGASSTMGTLTRGDDTMAGFSSRGPTYIDYSAKPDLVAPGTGTVSLAVPGSSFYANKAQFLLTGSFNLGLLPYLSLSGTSMSAPVVSGTVALMLQANPNLTPNLVKGILEYTAQVYSGYRPLEEGAGFLNSYGAVKLAKFFASAKPGDTVPAQTTWSRRIIWGNHMIKGGHLKPSGNAWATSTVWGSAVTDAGDNIVWGSMCRDLACDNIVWGSDWLDALDNIVWGSFDLFDNIVWGSGLEDNIVWGSDCGGADCLNVVWGSVDLFDNIVWGSALPGDNVVWGSDGFDNIVWASFADSDVTWGSDTADAVVFNDDVSEPLPSVELEFGDPPTLPAGGSGSSTTGSVIPGGGL